MYESVESQEQLIKQVESGVALARLEWKSAHATLEPLPMRLDTPAMI